MRWVAWTRNACVVLALLGVAVACGDPEAPPLPTIPNDTADAGGDDGATSSVECLGKKDGTPCSGDGKICIANVCIDPSCGDGVVTPPEECDHGTANGPSTGCETSCRFSCVAGDASRGCQSSNACVASGTCDPDKHTCTAGGPLASGASCGQYKLCVGGSCVSGNCGDSVVTSPEQCDNGTANGAGKGCEADCTFTCSNAATDCTPVPCNTMSCSAAHLCAASPDVSKNGQSCGGGNVCSNGACVVPGAVCGNGIKEGGEDCDFGTAGNGPNTGCEANCKFSCTAGSCVDANACHASPTCTAVTSNGQTGYQCVQGATKSDGTVCGTGSICLSGTCKPSTCGDGYRDPARSEQCDDGNLTNLDACDSACAFEQDIRAITMVMQFTTDSFCPANALGAAIARPARGDMQTSINDGIADGSISALFKMVSTDLAGQNAPVVMNSYSGAPQTATGYDGTNDVDWWYTPDPLTYDASRNATATLSGSYGGGQLDARGRLNLTMSVGGSLTLLHLSGAHIQGAIGTTNVPMTSTGSPPGHVAAEHLLATLQSYAAMGGTSTAPTALMCGNISAASLANTLVPASLLPGGKDACTEGYDANNRMLDVFVNGCHVKVFGLPVVAINPTQPDQVDPGATVAGAGGPYKLSVDATTKRVSTCKDKTGAVVNLTTCLAAAAYSSYFTFAADRVVIK